MPGDQPPGPGRAVLVPGDRVPRWCDNFEDRHGGAAYDVLGGALRCLGADGSTAILRLPFGADYAGPPVPTNFAEAVQLPEAWGMLLVRKGGFAVALLRGHEVIGSKVGQRHVQGRTKAGGQSQQRFARRRDNQAREAYEAAAEHCSRVLLADAPRVTALVCGGDRHAVEQVLGDPRLRGLAGLRREPWLPVPDPRRSVLDQAVVDATSVVAEVRDG